MDHISLPFSFDQINELLDNFPSENHHEFQQYTLVPEKNDDPPVIKAPISPIIHKKLRPSSSFASLENLKNVDEIKKLIHRDGERQRRQEMSTLYKTLRSELPIECLKGKRSAADHMHEAVGYIRRIQKSIEKLKQRKEKLMLIKNQETSSNISTTSCNEYSKPSCDKQIIPSVQVKSSLSNGGIEVCISTDGVVNLSGVLNIVCGEGLSVLHCVSARVDSRMLHTLLIQVDNGQDERAIQLQRRIEDFCDRTISKYEK